MHRPAVQSCLIVVGVALVAGCNWWLRITEVGGTVRVDGKPASGVIVVFEPLARNRPRAIAQTNSKGVYRLGRQGPGDKSGAASGKYRVQLTSDTEREGAVMIPAEYNRDSKLEFEVIPGRANVFDIDVKTK